VERWWGMKGGNHPSNAAKYGQFWAFHGVGLHALLVRSLPKSRILRSFLRPCDMIVIIKPHLVFFAR